MTEDFEKKVYMSNNSILRVSIPLSMMKSEMKVLNQSFSKHEWELRKCETTVKKEEKADGQLCGM